MEEKIVCASGNSLGGSPKLSSKWGISSHFSTKYHGFTVEHHTINENNVDVRGFEEPCIYVVKYENKDKVFLLLTYAIHNRETGEITYDSIPYDIRVVDVKDVKVSVLSAMLETGALVDNEIRASVELFSSQL